MSHTFLSIEIWIWIVLILIGAAISVQVVGAWLDRATRKSDK